MIIRGLFVVAATALALLLAAGCGDSGDDSATGSAGDTTGSAGDTTGSSGSVTATPITVDTGSLSKAAFIKRVEPICTKARRKFIAQIKGVWREVNETPRKPTETPREVEFYEKDFAETYGAQIDEISALGAPRGDEQEIAAYLEAVQAGIEEARDDPEAFGEAFIQRNISFKGTPQLTAAYGLRGCA